MSQNYDGRRISTDINPIPDSDKVELRKTLVPAMLHLSAPGDKTIRAQVAESVSLIAELDFPERWLDLIDQLVSFLSLTDTTTNTSVLETAHSICAPTSSPASWTHSFSSSAKLPASFSLRPCLHPHRCSWGK
ncbi:hypothetical protein FIBSPDRAFT_220491 [Athelia psychrophila]|uniref:Uncharacterized protein n=1 Tax=Athelia psychrophila TaxID=1759441 RepID=A0A165Z460_9AGAM|nr:hypothetical protein FIBSPDRAFT_220491 [Fibularhizoctonia sp. CBS 109695]